MQMQTASGNQNSKTTHANNTHTPILELAKLLVLSTVYLARSTRLGCQGHNLSDLQPIGKQAKSWLRLPMQILARLQIRKWQYTDDTSMMTKRLRSEGRREGG